MPEVRKDPIVGRWVIISTERGRRPIDSTVPPPSPKGKFCPFCYGNEDKTPHEIMALRPNNTSPNGEGWDIRVVPNKFPALQIEGELDKRGDGMFDIMNGIGAHEVIIETPKHDLTIENLSTKSIVDVFRVFRERIRDLSKDSRFRYILIFKNHGFEAGASLEHTHCQLIALPIIPNIVREELEGALNHYKLRERCVYCDIIRQETHAQKRVISDNDHFIVISPYAPRFPFEVCILPKKHISAFEYTSDDFFVSLAKILKETLQRISRVLNNPPYNLILHTSPIGKKDNDYYHWHIEIMPKLVKVAGFEIGSGFYINPTSPEEATIYLKQVDLDPK